MKNPDLSYRLLVIDDEVDYAESIAAVAQRAGFRTTVETHPQTVFNVDLDRFDVIVTDLAMPGVDGIELIRFFAEKRVQAALILVSGFESRVIQSAERLASARGLNVLSAFEKPFPVSRFYCCLQDFQHSGLRKEVVEKQRQASAEDLCEAIEEAQIRVAYQPKYSSADMAFTGFEALARWTHAEFGTISPAEFIPLAKENDLLGNLTMRVFGQVTRDLRTWKLAGFVPSVSVNIDPDNLTNLMIPEFLSESTSTSGIEPGQIIFELTESGVVDMVDAMDILTRIRVKGFGLSIDDYGTGYSTIKQLQNAPFNELKIDRSFVEGIDEDRQGRSLVEGMIKLAKDLRMTVVAEGVETMKQAATLAEMKCDLLQGFLFGAPTVRPGCDHWLSAGVAE